MVIRNGILHALFWVGNYCLHPYPLNVNFRKSCSLLWPQPLAQYLANMKKSINICWMNVFFLKIKAKVGSFFFSLLGLVKSFLLHLGRGLGIEWEQGKEAGRSWLEADWGLGWEKRIPECDSLTSTAGPHKDSELPISISPTGQHKGFILTPVEGDLHWDSEGGKRLSNSSFCQKVAEWEGETRSHSSWVAGR